MTAPQFLLGFIVLSFLAIAGLLPLVASLPIDGEGP